jgi:PAS domain S-box-containing protein
LDTSTEELGLSNEEITSMNEELQSANEELESSKEELHLLNEKLATINSQLEDKVAELERANDDVMKLVTSAEIAAVFLDPNLRIKRFTPAATGLLNLLPTDVGRPFRDLSPRFTDESLLEDMGRVMDRPTPLENDVRTNDGRFYVRRVLPYRTADGDIEGVIVTFIDITGRKRAEAALAALNEDLERRIAERTRALESSNESLRESRHRFDVFAQNVSALFAYVGADERFRFVNKACQEFFGLSASQMIGRTVREVIGERAYAHAKPHFEAVLSGQEQQFERPVLLEAHDDRWLHVHYVPDFDGNGAVLGVFTFARDITDRKTAERALKQSRDRLAAVVNTATDAIIAINAAGAIESFNPAAERMFGYAAEEVIGENVKILIPEPYRSEHDGYIRRYRETGEARIIGIGRELEARRKDGSIFPVDLAVSDIERGRRFTGIIRDIEPRKRSQAQLARSRETLRSLSARLITAEESERRRISRELHDDFSQRLAMLSVDIEALKEEERFASEREKLGEMSRRIADLTDDMHRLAYSLHPSILDHLGLAAALRRYVEEFTVRHGVEVVFRERGFTQGLESETASCLYRFAQESLANIAKHSGSPRATVRLIGASHALRISVRDYGQGFDLEEVRRRATTLGLVSMEERVRMMGGTFSLRSTPGKGTLVQATCPREAPRKEGISGKERELAEP